MDDLKFDNLFKLDWLSRSDPPSVVENNQLYNLSPDNPNITNDAPQSWIDSLPQDCSDSEDTGILGYNGESIDPNSGYATMLQNLGLGATDQSTAGATTPSLTTGADAAVANKPTVPLKGNGNGNNNGGNGKDTSLMDVLNSKMGAGIASQLVMGMLGGVGAGAAAQKNTEANRQLQNELMDKKYQQQLDYIRQMRQAGTVKRQDWKPVVATGLLGAK